jgi:hypothetical protein
VCSWYTLTVEVITQGYREHDYSLGAWAVDSHIPSTLFLPRHDS